MTRAVGIAGMAVLFVLTLASTDALDLGLGIALGAVLLSLLDDRLRLGPGGHMPPLAQRLLWFPVFAGAVVADVVQGTWDVALRAAHLRPVERPGLVRVPIGERSARGVAVSALATTLSPGTLLIDVDWERGDLLLHVIDASEPDVVRERLRRFYDRYQRRVWP